MSSFYCIVVIPLLHYFDKNFIILLLLLYYFKEHIKLKIKVNLNNPYTGLDNL